MSVDELVPLSKRTYFVTSVNGPALERGIELAQRLQDRWGGPRAVLAPSHFALSDFPELRRWKVATNRSGLIHDEGTVLIAYPNHATMQKARHLAKCRIVLAEWEPGSFEYWAQINQAFDVVALRELALELDDSSQAQLERIVYQGHNGWTGRLDVSMTRKHLADLAHSGTYDRDMVIAYARHRRGESGIVRLTRILDAHERELTPPRLDHTPIAYSQVW